MLTALAVPSLSSAQLAALWSTLQTLLNSTDLDTLLAQLPGAAIALTQDLASFYKATHTQQASVVTAMLQTYLSSVSGINPAELQILNAVVQRVVNQFVVLLPKIEVGTVKGFAYIEEELEDSTCWQRMFGTTTTPSTPAATPASS